MKMLAIGRLCLLALFLPFLTGACTSVEWDESEERAEYSLKVSTRAAQGSNIAYPVLVLAFREDGTLADSRELVSSIDKLSFKLVEGNYHLVALANHYKYTLPSQFSYASSITMPGKNYAAEPLMIGNASVSLGETNQTVNITMCYVVSAVSMELIDVPADFTGVDVCLSNVQTSRQLTGEGAGSESVKIPCVNEEGIWKTGTFYVYSSPSNPVLTVSLKSETETVSYSYTYSTQLLPGSPYKFYGSYKDGIVVNGSVSMPDWGSLVEVGFSFGPGVSTETENVYLDALPVAGSIWKGHVVAKTMNTTASETDLLLISLKEWSGLTSAYYATDPYVADRLAAGYQEAELSEWRIPTKDEASVLKATYYEDDLQDLNAVLSSAGGTPLSDEDEKGTNIRYLCEGATYSFAFKNRVAVTKAGSTVKTYHLRLVKTVHVKLTDF